MSSIPSKWYNHPWTIAIISGVILPPFFISLYDILTKKPILSTLISLLNIDFEIRIWQILILGIFILILYVSINKIKERLSNETSSNNAEPEWLNYKKDRFKKLLWTWDYKLNSDNTYTTIKLRPTCQKCESPMSDLSFSNVIEYKCPQCDSRFTNLFGDLIETSYDIRELIGIKIENGKYKNALNQFDC